MDAAVTTKLRFGFAGAVLLAGLLTLGIESTKWLLLTLLLYAAPLGAQIVPWRWIRAAGLWWGLFVLLQTLISPLVPGIRYQTLPPNFERTINVVAGYPGIEGNQHITTDVYGFRSNGVVDYADDSTFRIFAIGASTTEEIVLDDASTWTRLLEQQLNAEAGGGIEVINTGLSGLRAANHVATLRKALPLHPDMFIFLLGVNDWNHHIRLGNKGFWQREITSHTESFWLSNTPLGKLIRGVKLSADDTGDMAGGDIVEERGEYYAAMRDSLARADQRSFRPPQVLPQYSGYLNKISQLCSEAGVPCVFLTHPHAYAPEADTALRMNFWMTPPNESYTLDLESMQYVAGLYNDFLVQLTREEGLPLCDLAQQMPASSEFFFDDCHFNTRGAAYVAERVAACLGTNYLTD